MLKILSLTVLVAGILAGFVYLAGTSEPIDYEGQMTQTFDERRDVMWNIVLGIENFTKFKRGVNRVEILSSNYEPLKWKEHEKNHYRIYQVTAIEPQRYVKIELVESNYGLTGTWEYFLETEDRETKITIKEKSRNLNTWIRGIQNFQGRNVLLEQEMRWIRAALFNNLVNNV